VLVECGRAGEAGVEVEHAAGLGGGERDNVAMRTVMVFESRPPPARFGLVAGMAGVVMRRGG
jgi:hypothetical protein